jgi:hypothetical protein
MRGSTPTAAAGSTPPDEWLVAIPGGLPAYITVEAYHANLARLAANAARAETPGVVRAGRRCCQG